MSPCLFAFWGKERNNWWLVATAAECKGTSKKGDTTTLFSFLVGLTYYAQGI